MQKKVLLSMDSPTRMRKRKHTSKQIKEWLTYLLPLLTLLLSAFLSWRISVSAVKSTVVSESKRELRVKESAVLNKVVDIAKESRLVFLAYVTTDYVHEITVTSYMTSDSLIIHKDTTDTGYPLRDTSIFYVPRFVYYPESNERVLDCLDYIEKHYEDLGLKTYEQVYRLVRFTKRIPIQMINNKDISNNQWASLKTVNDFTEIVNDITESYMRRLAEFGLD